MEQSTLKQLRILIPGLIIIGCMFQVFKLLKITFEINDITSILLSTIIPLVLGAIYNSFDIRSLIMNRSIKKVRNNIKASLISIVSSNYRSREIKRLNNSDDFIHIFYNIIDNDNSLQIKAKNVYNNGIYLTSFADLAIISLASSFIYLMIYIFSENREVILNFLSLTFLTSIFGYIMHLRSVDKHITLSNDQIQYIKIYHKHTLIEKCDEILQ